MPAKVTIGLPFLEPVSPYVDPATDCTPVSLNVVYNIYERLVELSGIDGRNFQITAGLAKSWNISGDRCKYTFEIDPDARFASGRQVAASDVVFSLERLQRLAQPPSHLLPIADVRAVGKSAVEVILNRPSAAGLAALASPAFSIVDQDAITIGDDLGHSWLTANSAGSGAFTLQSVTDSRVVLAANPSHWRRAPMLYQAVFLDTPDSSDQIKLLRDGRADVLLAASPKDFAEAERDPSLITECVAPIQCPNLQLLKGTLGPDGRSLPENTAFNDAIKYSINYDAVAELFGGWGHGVDAAQTGLIPMVCGYASDLASYYRYDPAKAADLLSQAGYQDGLEIDFPYWTGSWGGVDTSAIAGLIEHNLLQVGIRPRLRSYTGEEYFSLVLDHRALTGITISMSLYQMPDPQDVLRRKMSFLNLTGNEMNAEDDLDAADMESSWEKRAERYRQLQLQFLAQNPMIFLLVYPHRVVRHRDIRGYRQAPHWPGPRLAELSVAEPEDPVR
jgi:peptide/nickel transport system substrate-binding protein